VLSAAPCEPKDVVCSLRREQEQEEEQDRRRQI